MGIFNRQNKAAKPQMIGDNGQKIEKVWTKAPTRDKSELPDLAQKSPRLDPVSIIAKSIAATEILVYDKREIRKNKDSAAPIIDHELYDLLERPIPRYPEIDGYALIFLTSALLDLTGEFGWLKLRNDRGKVIELNPIPFAWATMTPTRANPYYLIYPFGVSAGKAFPVKPEDMVFFKRVDLNDPYGRGRGSAESILDEVETDEYSSKAQKNFSYNDATPPFLLSIPGMPKDQADAFKAAWMQKLGGFLHRREPAIVGFDAKVQQLALSPVEMDFVESRKFLRDEALQHYQIPPEIYGVIENSNKSTINASFYLYHKNVLNDRYRFIERAISKQLVEIDFDRNLCVRFRDVVPEDENFKLQVLSTGVDRMLVKRSEFRKAFNLPVTDKDDVYIGSFNLYEIPASGKKEPPPPAPEKQPLPTDEEAKNIVAVKIIDSDTVNILFDDVKKESFFDEARITAIWKSFDARARAHEGEFIDAVKRFSKDQKKRVVDSVSGIENEKDIDKKLDTVFNGAADKALKSALAPAWKETMVSGREHAIDMIGKKSIKASGVDPDFEQFNKLANEWIEKFGLIKAQEINTTTYELLRKNLQAQISEAVGQGENLYQMKKRIMEVCDEVYDAMDAARAVKIARTESCVAQNTGSFITAKSEGVKAKRFLATKDDRVRDAHADADGQTVDIDSHFIVDGEEMMYPGDPNCSADNVVNCRCTMLFLSDE